MIRKLLLFFSISMAHYCSAKILIIVPVYNRPDFIEIQYKTFKKFLKDDYELMMFNDADNLNMQQTIEQICTQYGITCIRVPQELHNIDPNCYKAIASFRHGEVMQFALERNGFHHDDIVAMIDSDVFLIREFSIREYLGDCDITGFYYKTSHWIAPNFGFINMPKLHSPQTMNFRAKILADGTFVEAGSGTQDYIHQHSEIRWKSHIPVIASILFKSYEQDLNLDKNQDIVIQLKEKGYSNLEIKLINSLIDMYERSPSSQALIDYDIGFYETNIFLDYKHGSGWHGPNPTNIMSKDRVVKEFINSLLSLN